MKEKTNIIFSQIYKEQGKYRKYFKHLGGGCSEAAPPPFRSVFTFRVVICYTKLTKNNSILISDI